ncbi:MAG: hypothetical protein ACI83D_000180 [Planctomycetota bacterium]|jgi:hypothetical protein
MFQFYFLFAATSLMLLLINLANSKQVRDTADSEHDTLLFKKKTWAHILGSMSIVASLFVFLLAENLDYVIYGVILLLFLLPIVLDLRARHLLYLIYTKKTRKKKPTIPLQYMYRYIDTLE